MHLGQSECTCAEDRNGGDPYNHAASCPWANEALKLEADGERDRYLTALERIAEQGLGVYDPETRRMMGATGEPWEHWATIARRAIDAG